MRAFTQAAVLAFTIVILAPPAAAQQPKAGFTEQRTEGGTAVTFDDDLAKGSTFDPMGQIVRAPPRAMRVWLLRPRYNFVGEMLKSVENL
jgi:hypothetical protein